MLDRITKYLLRDYVDYAEALRRIDASDDPCATLGAWLQRSRRRDLPPEPRVAR